MMVYFGLCSEAPACRQTAQISGTTPEALQDRCRNEVHSVPMWSEAVGLKA